MYGAYIGGIFPRPERLIEATRKNSPELPRLMREEKQRVIELQVKAGLSFIADPMLDWDDMLRPFHRLSGIQEGPLTRFYENNTFYRKPIIVSKISGGGSIAAEHLSLDLLPKGEPWKASIPDPYTMMDLSEDRHYRDRMEAMFHIADALRAEASTLAARGAKFLQINAPSLASLRDKDVLTRAREAVERVVKGLPLETYLHLYFEDVSGIILDLLDFRVDGLGIDFRATPLERLRGVGFDKGLACGCVDARNTLVEAPQETARFAERAVDITHPKRLYLCPNCDLEFIPYTFAKRKVLKLAYACRMLRRG